MNNYREIQNQWDPMDQVRYPNLVKLITKMMEKGIKAGEKVN